MAKLLMISGDRALVEGKHGAFYNTLEEFHKYWDRIDIICPRISNNQQSTINNQLFGNVFIHPSPWSIWLQLFWILKKGREIYREQKFDLITVHEYPPFYNGIGARLLWNKIKVPYVLELFHIPGYPRAANIKEYIYKILAFLFLRHDAKKAKTVRIINQSQVRPFMLKAGIPVSKIIYMPAFYIDLNIFHPAVVQKEYDFIFIGRLVKNKGINLFIDAVKNTKRRALIVGDGPLKKDIKFKIENHNLDIDLYGWAKDANEIARLINKSRILVMPSYNEGGPRVVLEAMACGVPVVATLVGIVPDIIKDGESGDIIDWKAGDIAVKSIRLLNDQERYERYAKNGLEIVKQFERIESIRNYADKLKEIVKL